MKSTFIIYMANISIYYKFGISIFSLSQLIPFIIPLYFYSNLRREKQSFAQLNMELFQIIEHVIPMGLLIVKKG